MSTDIKKYQITNTLNVYEETEEYVLVANIAASTYMLYNIIL